MSAVSPRTRLGREILAVSAWLGVFPLVSRDVTWSELSRGGRLRQVRAVALGGALAFPLLVVFGGLFSSADAVFHDVVADVFAIDFDAVLKHIVLFGIFATLSTGYLRGALLRTAPSQTLTDGDSKLSLGIIPVATALGLVNLLFLFFVVIQLRYLFGGVELIAAATGLTYAAYSRRAVGGASPIPTRSSSAPPWRALPPSGRATAGTPPPWAPMPYRYSWRPSPASTDPHSARSPPAC